MSGQGAEAVLYDIDGDPMAVENGTAIPALTSVLVGGGSDGTNARFIKVDSSGNQIMIGLGTAGSPAGGVITIQGDPSGTPAPISGTVTANAGSGNFSVVQATAALLNATVIGTVTANIGTSGALALDTTLAKLTIAPGTAIGSNTLAMIGGHVTTVSPTYTDGNINPLSLTTAGALRVDGSGVTQPVSGTVTSNQGTANTLANAWPVKVTDGTNTLPTGDTVGRSIFNQISDGTTGPVAVKAASTAPTATDKALVVVLSPNQQSIPVSSGPSGATTGVIFGRVQNGAAGSLTVIRATAYVEQTTNFTGSVKSTSANDSSAGTGARTVKITYYDQTGAGPFTETVTMNGTTAVNLVNTDHCYIEKMEVLTVGSTGSNAGTITLHTGTGATGTTVGSIGFATNVAAVGDNTTLWAHHYIATGLTASIYELSGGTNGNQIGVIHLKVKEPLVSNAAEKQISDFITVAANGPLSSRTLANALIVTGFARVTAYVISNGSNTHYFTSFDYSEQ